MTGGHHVHWLPLVLAAMIALMSAWLNHLAKAPVARDDAGFDHDPDYIVEQFKVWTFDIEGKPRHHLTAERMIHYMDDDTSELAKPTFRLTSAKRAPIEVSADRGLIFGDRDSVHFLGDARATRGATPAQSAFTLSGEHLRVVPDAGILNSDKPVTLRQGKSVIRAGGLYVDERKQRLELTGGVRGLYEKTH
jgi:lipopolysaccharide export system protein LptC